MSFIAFLIGVGIGFLFGGLLPDQAKLVVEMIKKLLKR